MVKSEAARVRELDRLRDRYALDPEYRLKVLQRTRMTSAKMHAEMLADPRDPRHGTRSGYYLGKCKCRKCKDAMNDYDRAYRKKPPYPRQRHRWSSEIQSRLDAQHSTMKRMAHDGYRIERAASELGLGIDHARKLMVRLKLSDQFHENRLPKRCSSNHECGIERGATGRRSCRECIRLENTVSRARRFQDGLPANDPRHGTPNGYTNYGCRCEPCRAAGSEANKRRRKRREARR